MDRAARPPSAQRAYAVQQSGALKVRLTEESVLAASVLKWFTPSTATGVIVGASTALFLEALACSVGLTGAHRDYFLLLPLALVVSVLLIGKLAPDAEGHGTEKVIEAVHRASGRIKPAVVPVKLVATLATLACGGSAQVGLTCLLSARCLDLGLGTMGSALKDSPVPWYASAVKSAFTSITLDPGCSGEIVTPIVFVGAAAGCLHAGLLGSITRRSPPSD